MTEIKKFSDVDAQLIERTKIAAKSFLELLDPSQSGQTPDFLRSKDRTVQKAWEHASKVVSALDGGDVSAAVVRFKQHRRAEALARLKHDMSLDERHLDFIRVSDFARCTCGRGNTQDFHDGDCHKSLLRDIWRALTKQQFHGEFELT